jgi:hypothetical protein
MRRRRKGLPHSVQATLIWFVLSTLLAMGVLHLRAKETISDRLFQPLATVLCSSDQRLETRYRSVEQSPRRNFGDPRKLPQAPVAALQAADCVRRDGHREPAPAFPVLVWLSAATVVGSFVLAAWVLRRASAKGA